jgi:cytochrome c oxidase assembly protein subunit 15
MASSVDLAIREPARPRPRALSWWLLAVAALVFAMVVVGGITRLTESGLSITRWEPLSGALPPIGETAWKEAFEAYRATPQYEAVNRGMTLGEYKDIYFWEYVHRLLGRLIGLAFALPLAWFAWRKAIPRGYGWRLGGLLALGGLQGAVGWWMVASGLVDRPDVSHIRLAIHLLLALFIMSALLWVALDLRGLDRAPLSDAAAAGARMPTLAIWTLSALALQLMFGAYVAGLDAGYAFDTWPKMAGEWFPSGTPMLEPFLRNLVDNPMVVQFVHRWLAWAVAAFVWALAFAAWRRALPLHAAAVGAAVFLQILLGILTLLSGVHLWIAVSHQAMAALLLAAIVTTAHRLGEPAA